MSELTPQQAVIACRGVSRTFSDGKLEVEVLKHIDLTVAPGESLAIVGASGAGKSTLLHLLGGLDQPTGGELWIAGANIAKLSDNQRSHLRNRALGFVYQFHHLLPEFSALENVAMPLLIRGAGTDEARAAAAEILKRVGLAERLDHKPGELSGGERQRAAVARALVTKPQAMLGDEPTGNLDDKTSRRVFELMRELNQEFNTSLILVTHDLKLAAQLDRTLRLRGGGLHPD